MDRVKTCLVAWSKDCQTHFDTYASAQVAIATCNLPATLLDQMLAGFWQRECTSAGSCYGVNYYDNIPFNIMGMRQMADKATDMALLPSVCQANLTCLVSEVYLKQGLSECNHAAYANAAWTLSSSDGVLLLVILFACGLLL